ncbi:aldo-keto reductase [Xylaria bambusicola]|uniref:aldo-keto reductase n=1 Tax=Xylaria bambusicola TaxID=326684 RepID=UPI00200778DF|nr:aldo-keto reductase [Xylaria bambusicola]KAI0517604.1 aldo-keto reductase [Xylaria bambusicola]
MAAKFPQRKLGDDLVSAIGLGCMGMTFAYASGGFNDEEAYKVLTLAADSGMTFWDTADMYGPFTNEKLIGKWFKETGRRNEIFLATKFANRIVDGNWEITGDPAYVKEACNASLERLQTDHIDLYYQHRIDPKTPIEHTVQAMAELKKEGKIRYLGLSECSERSLRRAHAVHPITAIQMEYSPFALQIESEPTNLLKVARELGVTVVAYSPLGRGFLTGTITSRDQLDKDDRRRMMPRFSEENFAGNVELAQLLGSIAKEKGATPGQLSIAWLLAQGDDIIPIPGTKRVKYLEENMKSVDIKLTKEEDARIRQAIESVGGSKGQRYAPDALSVLFGDSPEL